MADRAAVVALDIDRVLVIRREKPGRRYAVLPGGGIEPDEEPAAAALRELMEETGLTGRIERPLWTLRHEDRRAHYFLAVVPVASMTLGGPELAKQSELNRYEPCWIFLGDLEAENLQPEALRSLLRGLV